MRRAPWGVVAVAVGVVAVGLTALVATHVSSSAAPKVPDVFGRATLIADPGYTVSRGAGDHAGHFGPARLVIGTRTVNVARNTPIFSWCDFIDTSYEHCFVQIGLRRHTTSAEWVAAFEQPTTDRTLPYRYGTIRRVARDRLELSDGTTIPLSARSMSDNGTTGIVPCYFAQIFVDARAGSVSHVTCRHLA